MGDLVTFTAWGHRLDYWNADYNSTRVNERAIELPVAQAWLDAGGDPQVRSLPLPLCVEFGNVLSWYELRPPLWRCVDLYEQGDGVENADVRTWDPGRTIDRAVAISTFEHVGLEDGTDPWGAAAALGRVVGMLDAGGSMLVTFPLGQNPRLDAHLLAGRTGASLAATFVRDLDGDTWIQTPEPEWRPYIGGGRGAQSCWIGQYGRPLLT